MTQGQVKAIQASFTKVAPISEQAAAIFYARLFEIAPAVKPLFRGDMKEQGRKLMATLAVVVNGIGSLESVLPAASALAKQHGTPVDAGTRAWRRMDAGTRSSLERRLHSFVRIHDR
jgi:hemoglobin-like flavoprotein